MPETLIAQFLRALADRDRMAMRRIRVEAADYDQHNPGSRLVDELDALRTPSMAA